MNGEPKPHGGPAFPLPIVQQGLAGQAQVPFPGMTLWDYFAAAALNGLLSRPSSVPMELPAIAGDVADKMIAERAKRFTPPAVRTN